MTDYSWCVPAATVLPEYTDESLRNDGFYGRSVAADLLTVPAEYRQTVEAQVTHRSYRFGRAGDRETVGKFVADPHEVRRAVLAELQEYLANAARAGAPEGDAA